LNKTTVFPFIRYSSVVPETSIPPFLSHHFHLQSVDPTNVLFIAGTVVEMVSKTKQSEEEENPFLPPPVDLDKIPLVDKDHLIADTICSFDFYDL
jgi:hypothetical protein